MNMVMNTCKNISDRMCLCKVQEGAQKQQNLLTHNVIMYYLLISK